MRTTPPSGRCVFLDPDGRVQSPGGERLFDAEQVGWQGLPLEAHTYTGPGEGGPAYAAHPTLALCTGGHGHNDVRCDGRWVRLPFRRGVMALQADQVGASRQVWTGRADEILILQMPPEWVSALLPEQPAGLGLMPLAPFEDDTLASLLLAIRDECRRGAPTGRAYAQGLSLAVVSYLQHRYAAVASPPPACGLTPRDLARIEDYIAHHLSHDIGVDDLAGLLRLSPSHFTRLFRRTTGVPPYRYLQRRRIERAIALLRGADSLAEIAQQLGFANQSHFTQVFRQHMGSTPARVRAEWRGVRGTSEEAAS